MGKDKSGKLRRIDKKYTKHQNRRGSRNSFSDCFTTLLPVGALGIVVVVLLVRGDK